MITFVIPLVLDPNVKDLYCLHRWEKQQYEAGMRCLETVVGILNIILSGFSTDVGLFKFNEYYITPASEMNQLVSTSGLNGMFHVWTALSLDHTNANVTSCRISKFQCQHKANLLIRRFIFA